MSRKARVKSGINIYHVVLKGINKEKIFIKNIYKNRVIEILDTARKEINFSVFSYCILDNHIHLLIKYEDDKLEMLMKSINVKYALYYNHAENRDGHVFQDRFESEAIEDYTYMQGVIRYIHNDPVRSGLTTNILDYYWSSAKDYMYWDCRIISENMIKKVMVDFRSKCDFIEFHNVLDNNIYLDIKEDRAEAINSLLNRTLRQFIDDNNITKLELMTLDQREAIAEIILKLGIINRSKVAELCDIPYYNVIKISNKIKSQM